MSTQRQDSAAGDIQSARRAVKDGVARQQQSLVRVRQEKPGAVEWMEGVLMTS
jgi:hypothetical protein